MNEKIEKKTALMVAADVFDADLELLTSNSRRDEIVKVRHALMWALYERLGSYQRVGELLGFDHTSVLHGRKRSLVHQRQSDWHKSQCVVLARRLGGVDTRSAEEYVNEIIRKLVAESSATALTPEYWPESKIIKNAIAQSAKHELARFDPLRVCLVPVVVTVAGERFLARFESCMTGLASAGFRLMDYEKMGSSLI